MPVFEVTYLPPIPKLKAQENLEQKHLRRMTANQLVSDEVQFSQQNTDVSHHGPSLLYVTGLNLSYFKESQQHHSFYDRGTQSGAHIASKCKNYYSK